MADINFKVSKENLLMIDKLATRAKMQPADYMEMVIDSHVTEYQIRTCPECGNEFRGTTCNCKAPEIL